MFPMVTDFNLSVLSFTSLLLILFLVTLVHFNTVRPGLCTEIIVQFFFMFNSCPSNAHNSEGHTVSPFTFYLTMVRTFLGIFL